MVFDDDDERDVARRWTDFDCPDCSANNPVDESFGNGDDVRCYYCGSGFRVKVSDSGRVRFLPE